MNQSERQQAEEARQAMSQAASLFAKNLGHTVDPRTFTKQHPWMGLTGAAVGGFLAATLLIPSEEDRVIKRLMKLERAANPEKFEPHFAVHPDGSQKPSTMSRIITEVLSVARPIIMSALSAGMGPHQQPGRPETQTAADMDPQPSADISSPQAPGTT